MLCLTCSKSDVLRTKSKGTAKWVQTQSHSHPGPSMSPSHDITPPPYGADLLIIHDLPKSFAGSRILWWGATPRSIKNANIIPSAPEAYDVDNDYPNSGVIRVAPNGTLALVCQSPQPYREEERVYPRHIHFRAERSGGRRWSKTVFTLAAYPAIASTYEAFPVGPPEGCSFVSLQDVKENLDDIWMVSAIPGKRWRQDKDLNIDDGVESIASQVGDQPVVVYCAGPHCTAAETLVLRLTEQGVANVFVFQGGLVELP